MEEKLLRYIEPYTSSSNYLQHQVRFESLNSVRIQHFLMPVAVINFLLAVLPGFYSIVTTNEFSFQTNRNLLFIRLSLSLSMLVLYFAFPKNVRKKTNKNNVLLGKLFVAVILLHTMGISLADALTGSTVSSFLLGICGVLTGIYWPPKRQFLFVGTAIALFWLLHYTFYDIPFLFLTQLTGQLLFASIFFLLSRSLMQSKADDFDRLQRLQVKSVELRQSHDKLRRTEHALSSLKQHTRHGLFRLKRSLGFTYANEYLADMLGFSTPGELLKNPKSSAYIATQDLDGIARKVNQQGFVDGVEIQITRKNGTKFWALVSCSIYTDTEAQDVYYEGTVTDITYRKKALQEAVSNAKKLEQAEKIANTGFYEINLETVRFTYSSGYCTILGIPSAQTISLQEHLAYIVPEHRAMVKSTLLHSLTNAEEYKLSYNVTAQDGQLRRLVSRGQVIQDEQGKNHLILGTVLDVTQLEENQEALEKTEAIIRTAFNYNNNFGICILDKNFKILEFNEETASRVISWRGIELRKGTNFQEVMHPETAARFVPILNKALKGESTVFEYQPRTENGNEVWAEFVIGPVKNQQGEVLGILIIAVDITQRKQHEKIIANLSLVASHTDNAVMISDRKHRVEWVNEAFVRQTGFKLSEIKGKYPKEFMLSAYTDSQMLSKLNNALREGRSFNNELQLSTRNAGDIWVQLTINPVYNKFNKVERFISVYTDLTQRKRFEEQLEEAKITAEQSVEAKDHFLSTMSHELRTPLNGVIGLTYHLLQNEPRQDQQEDLQTLKFSAENLLSLINDILDFSKIEAGKVKLQQLPFNLRDILRSLHHSFVSQAETKGLKLKLNIAPDVPAELIGDSVRLTQILTNLLGNALKFTHHGQICLRVSCQQQNQDLVQLLIEVEDTGIGIEEEKLNTIFLKFEQATQLTSNYYGGTGLGLAIAKQLVELQGGKIEVDSVLEVGTHFKVQLPYSLGTKANLKEIALNHTTSQPDLDFDNLNVLIAEDNKVNQAVAKKFLQNWDIKYIIAENGKEAVEAARQQVFNLILMDLQMPVMDGFEATKQIRALSEFNYKHTPIIAITAGGNAGTQNRLIEAGLDDMLLKPFTPDQLLTVLKKGLKFAEDHSRETTPSETMNNTTPDKKKNGSEVLDISGIVTVAGGDAEFVQELLNLYVQQFTDIPLEIEAAQISKDRLQLRRIFHKLRPSVVMLKVSSLQGLGDEIHNDLHDSEVPFESISAKLDEYTHRMKNVLKLLIVRQQEHLNVV